MKAMPVCVLLLCILGAALEIMARVNLNVAIVSMVDSSQPIARDFVDDLPIVFGSNDHPREMDDSHHIRKPEERPHEEERAPSAEQFNWTPTTQGIILGAFNLGIMVTHVPGGWLAETSGGKWPVAFGLLVSCVVNLATPFVARYAVLMTTSRIVLGMGQGIIMPSCYALVSQWLPAHKTTVYGLLSVGASVGNVVSHFLTGYLCQFGFSGGWPSSFFVPGLIILLWLVIWVPFAKSKPKGSNFSLSQDSESSPLLDSTKSINKVPPKVKPSVPWGKMLRSGPVWALIVCKFSVAWGGHTVVTKLPTYMTQVLGVPIYLNGFTVAVVYAASILTLSTGGYLSNILIQSGRISSTNCRKIFQATASFGCAMCLSLIPWAGYNTLLVFALLIIGMTFSGLISGGEIPIVADMTTQFPATLFAVTNMVTFVAGLVTPWLSGVILDSATDPYELKSRWNFIFYLSAAIYASGAVVFVLFASAKTQDWDSISILQSKDSDTEKQLADKVHKVHV